MFKCEQSHVEQEYPISEGPQSVIPQTCESKVRKKHTFEELVSQVRDSREAPVVVFAYLRLGLIIQAMLQNRAFQAAMTFSLCR